MKKYAQVTVKNNWELLEYKVGDLELPHFVGSKEINVKFPDGTKNKVVVEGEKYTKSYKDMGHTNTAKGTKYSVQYEINGIRVKLPLELFQVKIKDLLGESDDTK